VQGQDGHLNELGASGFEVLAARLIVDRMMGASVATDKIVVSGFRHVFDTADGPVQATGVIDLKICSGEFVTLVGPSGCGKTTLLKALAGFLRPTEGIPQNNSTPSLISPGSHALNP
jgi:ABC-type glutathione transport system ATPase component